MDPHQPIKAFPEGMAGKSFLIGPQVIFNQTIRIETKTGQWLEVDLSQITRALNAVGYLALYPSLQLLREDWPGADPAGKLPADSLEYQFSGPVRFDAFGRAGQNGPTGLPPAGS